MCVCVYVHVRVSSASILLHATHPCGGCGLAKRLGRDRSAVMTRLSEKFKKTVQIAVLSESMCVMYLCTAVLTAVYIKTELSAV